MSEDLLVEMKNNVAIVSLNRPDVLNSMSLEMRAGLADTFEGFAKDDNVRAVVITGKGKAFSAGGDIKGWNDPNDENRMQKIMEFAHRAVKAIYSLEKPIIAMVNGDAVGAGCNLALACDIIIASENARFGQVFVKIGLGPDWGGAYILPRLIGLARAKELLFTGKLLGAKDALEMGLINNVVPQHELEETAMKLAEKLSQSATIAIGKTKKFLHKAWQMDIIESLEYEASMQKALMDTIDHQQAVKAFINKDKPVFIGK
ncbi:MAG: enoyl-CoA hydratase [Spirochaetota bacterium]|nr:enoyl-CoA hydratase [Spirochaetota bacterium]